MLFPQMIDIFCRVIDLETIAHLKKMFTQYNLPPPHFYFTTGKSTNHRVSNQATVIYLVIEGKRSAIPLGVKPVQSTSDGEGGKGAEVVQDTII